MAAASPPDVKASSGDPDDDTRAVKPAQDAADKEPATDAIHYAGDGDGGHQYEKEESKAADATATSVPLPAPSRYKTKFRRFMTPPHLRWNPEAPAPLTLFLCVVYALAGAFTVSNLYYNQPILNKLAHDFDVSYEASSQVPTLLQAGYAVGLVFVLPLGDMLERRPFIICLVFFTATVWIGLCVTTDFTVFRTLSFICGITTVVPQLLIPLVGDYAPERRKAALLSIVVSGLLLGILSARLLSGVVANFTHWRNIYWLASGAQYLVAIMLYVFMPDYPSTNAGGLGYFKALSTIPYIMVTEPVLVQASVTAYAMSAVFTCFWTTLTFLLASPPFEYSSLTIGLFSLLGVVAIITIPIYGRVIDHFIPLFTIIMGQIIVLIGCALGTSLGTFSVVGPVIQGIAMDFGMQTAQIANRSSIFGINPKARNRINTAYMACSFAGQLTGTAVGNRLYAEGGWHWSGAFSLAIIGASLVVSIARGPRETGWVGWKGGWALRKYPKTTPTTTTEETTSGSEEAGNGVDSAKSS